MNSANNSNLKKNNSLQTVNPKLAAEWHPTKNAPLTPIDVTPMSNKKVWWICSKGHEWYALISNRTKGRGCPYCSGRKVHSGNSLQAINPELAKQWHPTKNAPLTPNDVTPMSKKKAWWVCSKGHEWFTLILLRSKGHGCPYCVGIKVNSSNSLQTINPELAKQWHPTKNVPLTPNAVTVSSRRNIWWVCSKGHEWKAAIADRSKGRGCPYCAGTKVCSDNCLQTVNPKLAMEWHPTKNAPLTPADVTRGARKKVWWICSKGHEWEAEIRSRLANQCPYCSNHKVNSDNCLQTIHPELAKEWHPTKNIPLTPADVIYGTNKKYWWICSKGHEWEARISHRISGTRCPYCSNFKVNSDNCLQATHPELAKQWHPTKNIPLTPANVVFGAKLKAWWVCFKGHEWKIAISHRTKAKNSVCPYCSGLKSVEEDSLATISPWIAQQWHPDKNKSWTPKDVSPHAKRNIWWLCKNGHEYRELVVDRYRRGGCAVCILKKEY